MNMQKIVIDERGVVRFKANAIVRYLLDTYTDMNALAMLDFSNEDRQQFAQLIGYSLSGYGDLSYVDNLAYEKAHVLHEAGGDELRAAILYAEELERRLSEVKQALKPIVSDLWNIHEDDLE
ncbi:MAG: hypothetical protein WBO55_11455 [Rhizobiaceae bacterium]